MFGSSAQETLMKAQATNSSAAPISAGCLVKTRLSPSGLVATTSEPGDRQGEPCELGEADDRAADRRGELEVGEQSGRPRRPQAG